MKNASGFVTLLVGAVADEEYAQLRAKEVSRHPNTDMPVLGSHKVLRVTCEQLVKIKTFMDEIFDEERVRDKIGPSPYAKSFVILLNRALGVQVSIQHTYLFVVYDGAVTRSMLGTGGSSMFTGYFPVIGEVTVEH